MKHRAWRLPWTSETVPHALLDILRGCNITCRACYNTDDACVKPLEQVREEFELLCRRRKLDSISIVGGEPTLHPDLCSIVRMIKSRGVSVEMFTNGLPLEPELLAELKAAGTDIVFLHIDAHQDRPDLGAGPMGERLRELRAGKARAVAEAGIEVGLAITVYADALAEVDDAVEFVLSSPHADYLLIALHRDVPSVGPLVGDLESGMHAADPAANVTDGLSNDMVRRRIRDELGLEPFAFVGSNRDPQDARWLSYMAGSIIRDGEPAFWQQLAPSAIEKLFVAVHKLLKGRYPFFVPHSPGRFRLELVLNGLTGGSLWRNLRVLRRSLAKGSMLRAKRLLLQCPAGVTEDGTVVHCENCPDATIRHGRLVPVCVGDQILEDDQPG